MSVQEKRICNVVLSIWILDNTRKNTFIISMMAVMSNVNSKHLFVEGCCQSHLCKTGQHSCGEDSDAVDE